MSRNITIVYELNPPTGVSAQNLNAHKTHTFPIGGGDGSLKSYYARVREGVARGKEVIGEELTAWRDVVGNEEQKRESNIKKGKDEEEEEEEEEG